MSALELIGRAAGILLHPSSLPSGRLDNDAYRWVDFMHNASVRVWQMLPLGVPLVGLSPYQCASAFAINPTLFPETPSTPPFAKDIGKNLKPFTDWHDENAAWLDDYSLFMVLKKLYAGQEWSEWPQALRRREPQALQAVRKEHTAELQDIILEQYRCYQQWRHLRHYAAEKDVYLFGDMPIFVAYDSADVWAHPERFLLDPEGQPTFVTGVPPDYFSKTGQRWGNPHYDWEYMRKEDFRWWKERLRYHFEFFDLVRIDHFRGLAASWMIAAECKTAIEGFWQTVPGGDLLHSIQQDMGQIPLVAEDLGVITPDVVALRDDYGLPGMSVLQFAFDQFEDNPHKPQNVRPNTVYYTGTHDNDTLLGWFNSLDADYQRFILKKQGITDVSALADSMLDTIFSSRALLAAFPLQDALHLGSEARMNTPGTVTGNWLWQFAWRDIPDGLASNLHEKLKGHQRCRR